MRVESESSPIRRRAFLGSAWLVGLGGCVESDGRSGSERWLRSATRRRSPDLTAPVRGPRVDSGNPGDTEHGRQQLQLRCLEDASEVVVSRRSVLALLPAETAWRLYARPTPADEGDTAAFAGIEARVFTSAQRSSITPSETATVAWSSMAA